MIFLVVLSLTATMVCHAQFLGGLTGAPVDAKIDASDPNVMFAVNAINGFYAKQGDNDARTFVKVVKAQTQVVSGTMYHLVLEVSAGGKHELCEVKVWSRPWLAGDEATMLSQDPACKPMMVLATKPSMLAGGETPIDVNNADVQNALTFAVTTVNAQSNEFVYRKPVKVESVTSQVVSGMAYHFRGVHMAATNCNKNTANVVLEQCDLDNNSKTSTCDFDVWWQSWMTPEYKLTNFSCQ